MLKFENNGSLLFNSHKPNPVFPIHWFISSSPPQYQNWPQQIDFTKGFAFVE